MEEEAQREERKSQMSYGVDEHQRKWQHKKRKKERGDEGGLKLWKVKGS